MAQAEREAQLSQAKVDLKGFLADLQDLLAVCFFERSDLVADLGATTPWSWPAVQARFTVVKRALDGLAADGQEQLTKAKVNQLNRELAAHGLTGDELAFKLQLFHRQVGGFLDELAAQSDAEEYWAAWIVRFRGSAWWERRLTTRFVQRLESLRRAGRRILRGRLKLALQAANVVLGSLGQALSFLPGVGAAVGGIGELKDALEVLLGEPDDGEKPPRRRPSAAEDNTPRSALQRLGQKFFRSFW